MQSGTHQIALNQTLISYRLEYSHRKSIGFIVGKTGLTVRAPVQLSEKQIETFIRQKSDWICKHLQKAQEQQERLDQTRIIWANGAIIQYLGAPFILQLASARSGIDDIQKRIHLTLPLHATQLQIQRAVEHLLQKTALALFEKRLNHYAPQLGVRWTQLKLSNANTRWGSAKTDGSIRLHWKLVHYRLAVLDYVVVHELSHLRHMNHSPLFWATVASILPNYAQLKKELRAPPPR